MLVKLNGISSKGPGKIMALAAKVDPKNKYILNLKELLNTKKLYKVELNRHKYLKNKIFDKIGIKEKNLIGNQKV